MLRAAAAALVMSATLVVVGTVPAGAQPAAVIDQQQTDTSARGVLIAPNQTLAQTFTAGRSGTLTQIDLFLQRTESPLPDITVEIRTVEAGLPSEVVLSSTTIPEAHVPFYPNGAFVTAPFTAPAAIVAGTPYAIVASSSAPLGYGWEASRQDVYSGGAGYYRTLNPSIWRPIRVVQAPRFGDLAFRTYVTPATPTTKDQCKNGGWKNFTPILENQGQCVAFVERGPKPVGKG